VREGDNSNEGWYSIVRRVTAIASQGRGASPVIGAPSHTPVRESVNVRCGDVPLVAHCSMGFGMAERSSVSDVQHRTAAQRAGTKMNRIRRARRTQEENVCVAPDWHSGVLASRPEWAAQPVLPDAAEVSLHVPLGRAKLTKPVHFCASFGCMLFARCVPARSDTSVFTCRVRSETPFPPPLVDRAP